MDEYATDQIKQALDSADTMGQLESSPDSPKSLDKTEFSIADLNQYIVDEGLKRKLPENYARHFQAVLLAEEDGGYLVGMVNPLDIFATDGLRRILKKPLKFVTVNPQNLFDKLDQIYRRSSEITDYADKLATELKPAMGKADQEQELAIRRVEPAVTKLLNSLFEDAVKAGASDIHIEPSDEVLRIRLRVDGLLQEQTISTAGKSDIALALAQRLKLMAGLNIAEKRLPQDGRFEIEIFGKKIDVRTSTMPVRCGESVVLRLLNKSAKLLKLDSSGMPPDLLACFRRLIRLPSGIILITGPTGSGKTTTLYGALSEINDVAKNIVTIEDPVEYVLERANQIQVNSQIGLTFGRVLRSVLRQDPDVILVGEIRDQETASIALRSALTGHLVFATLHTNDAVSTAVRLTDIGTESYLVASTVRAIIAQRLVRKICPSCSSEYQPNEQEQIFFNDFFGETFLKSTFRRGVGCAYCNFTGYKGRIGVFELLEFDTEMREALRVQDTNSFIRVASRNRQGSELLTNAFALACQGVVTLEEVMRISGGL